MVHHLDAVLFAENGRVRRVDGPEVEGAEPVEGGTEGVRARIGGGEGVVVGQVGVAFVAGEVDRTGVAGGDVAVGVDGGDREGVRLPPQGGRGEAGHDQADGRRRVHLDAALGSGDARV